MNVLQIHGLTHRQKALADLMWNIDEWDDVEAFVATLSPRDKAEALSILELIRIEFIESLESQDNKTPEATELLKKYML